MTTSRRGLGGLLRHPAYRRLWLARTVSQVGDVAQFTTLALLLVALTGSGLGVSGAVLAEIAPVLLLAPLREPGRPAAPREGDGHRRPRPGAARRGPRGLARQRRRSPTRWRSGCPPGQVFFSPAAQSLLPSVVTDDALVAANSGIWTGCGSQWC